MRQKEPDWKELRSTVAGWFNEAYPRVQKAQPDMKDEQSHVGFAASFCLLSCTDYMESAFDAFEKGCFHAGLACCRPVAETAITFYWCVQDDLSPQSRFKRWMKDTWKEDERLLKGLLGTSVFQHEDGGGGLADSLKQVREMLDKVCDLKELPHVKQMLESMDPQLDENLKASDIYPMLYQFLCGSAHSNFRPDRYFHLNGDVFTRIDRPVMPAITPWVALTSAYWMAVPVLMYFGWDYTHLKAEYKKVRQKMGWSNAT